nr:unnamed protein product [Callosobruchus analis]
MRNYKRTSQRKPLTEVILREARQLIDDGVSIRQAAEAVGYHESTLRQRLKTGKGVEFLGRYKAILSKAQENEVVQHCKNLDKRFYGLTLKSLRFLLYCYAERNHIEHPFSHINQLAGRDYTRCFMKRNRLSLRVPRKTSIARTMGFNRIQLAQYFENLDIVLKKYKFPPSRIYNIDETGIQTVPNKLPKHVAPIGKKNVSKAVAAEQGQTITIVCSMSAIGHHVPPYFVFARKRMNPLLMKDGPTGCDMAVTDTGYMNTPTLLKYLGNFEKYTSPTEQNPVLVLLDNHVSHVSLQAVTFAKDNYIHLLSLPPHSSQKTQPLDHEDFMPAEVTEQDLDTDVSREDLVFIQFEPEEVQERPLDTVNPLPSQKLVDAPESILSHSGQPTSPLAGPSEVSASDIFPLPKIKIKRKRTRKRLKSTLLTSTPNKERLTKEQEEEDIAAREKERKQLVKKSKLQLPNFMPLRGRITIITQRETSCDYKNVRMDENKDLCDSLKMSRNSYEAPGVFNFRLVSTPDLARGGISFVSQIEGSYSSNREFVAQTNTHSVKPSKSNFLDS